MRNQEAARYARWSAIAAGLIALLVVGVYAERAITAARRRSVVPATVPVAVQQQTDTFSYKRVEKDRTIFAIRASRATQFKEHNRALLEDVWITIYGRDGSRNDNLHARECGYQGDTGNVHCQGEVSIDIQAPNSSSKARSERPAANSLSIKTSNLSFDGQTGEASTPAPVDFVLPQGSGRGVGVSYSTRAAVVRVLNSVEFDLAPSERTGGAPVTLSGSNLEIRRDDRQIVLGGPVTVRQGDRELSASRVSVQLDENFHASHVLAEGRPAVHSLAARHGFAVSADTLEGFLNPGGWVQTVVANGNVEGLRHTPAGTDHFSSSRVEVSFEAQRNILREMTATGGVVVRAEQNGVSHLLKTNALRISFTQGDRPDHQRVDSAETLAAATIDSESAGETTEMSAPKFAAQFAQNGRLQGLRGIGGVAVRRVTPKAAPQTSTSDKLAAAFGPDGQWTTVEQSGHVHFVQADRQATASFARFDRGKDEILMTGSPTLTDSVSRTTAQTVTLVQKSGEIDATGGVLSTYLPSAQGSEMSIGSGPANISADSLTGSASSRNVTYAGHARLWQGQSVLDADQITVRRDDRKMQASGHVVAVFPQSSGAVPVPGLKRAAARSGPTLWRVQAPLLTYWNREGKARLEGGVTAVSQEGSIESRTLDVYFNSGSAGAAAQTAIVSGGASPSTNGQLSRAVALGGVVVRQGDRHGTAEQAEYIAADGKFVLSGGQPTLTDASGNTTSGRSLTFFLASDTILIDSQAGSRTLTKHRVEK